MVDWHRFLLTQSADFDDNGFMLFKRAPSHPIFSVYDPFVTELFQFSLFFVTGRDATKFLQGQMTADIQRVSAQQATMTAFCSAKGRIISTALLWHAKGGYACMVPKDQLEHLKAHLQKYILFSKVSLTDAEQTHILALSAQCDNDMSQSWPRSAYGTQHTADASVIAIPGKHPHWLYVSDKTPQLIETWQAAAKQAQPIGCQEYAAINIFNAQVNVNAALREQLLPQMIGLEHLEGLSLKKGCFVGQEVIARTSNLGKLKRHLYYAECKTKAHIAVGEAVVNAAGQGRGLVVASAPLGDVQCCLLVMSILAETESISIHTQAAVEIRRYQPSLVE